MVKGEGLTDGSWLMASDEIIDSISSETLKMDIRALYREPSSKRELFFVLCAINYANALVKGESHPKELQYHVVKGCVSSLVQKLIEGADYDLAEDIFYNNMKDCVYISCYGLQFSFHKVGLECLTIETLDQITDNEKEWCGLRLQPIADKLYELAQKVCQNDQEDDNSIRAKITKIIKETSELQ